MMDFYQNIPQYMDPIAFTVGSFAVRWYSLSYLAAFAFVFLAASWRIKKEENKEKSLDSEMLFDVFIVATFGMFLGGRIGYVLFYNPVFFLHNPLAIISPFHEGSYMGIFGMSYYGAVIGIFLSVYFFLKKKNVDLWRVGDFIVPLVAGGYFFGRVGNFLNGELVGRKTEKFWGMYFSEEGFLRHPSQLYEAFFEGLVLFAVLWALRNKARFSGQITLFYLLGYALIRFLVEYFRAPDKNIGFLYGFLTMGQVLSLSMFLIAAAIYFQKIRKNAILEK